MKKHQKGKSLFDRLAGVKQIYPRDELAFIRINFCKPKEMHETSHLNMYGTSKSIDFGYKSKSKKNTFSSCTNIPQTLSDYDIPPAVGNMTTTMKKPHLSLLNLTGGANAFRNLRIKQKNQAKLRVNSFDNLKITVCIGVICKLKQLKVKGECEDSA
jgi:hypothetical protein